MNLILALYFLREKKKQNDHIIMNWMDIIKEIIRKNDKTYGFEINTLNEMK